MPPYPGWPPWREFVLRQNPPLHMWVPSDQTSPNIRDVLTAHTFHSDRDADPSAFLRGVMAVTAKACERAKVNGPVEQTEEGYAVAYAQIYCARKKDSNQDVDFFLKAIRGNDALYVVQREFRRPAIAGGEPGIRKFDDRGAMIEAGNALKAANDYLKSVHLCPVAGGSERCTATQPNQP